MRELAAGYFDGVRARRHSVKLSLDADAIRFSVSGGPDAQGRAEDGAPAVTEIIWPLARIRRIPGPPDRLILADGDGCARLHVIDPHALAAVTQHLGAQPAAYAESGQSRHRIVLWLMAAIVSILACALILVPLLAGRLAPLVPVRAEIRLGEMVEKSLRRQTDLTRCSSPEGEAALARLTGQLVAMHDLHLEPQVRVVANGAVNALALPGGRIYVFNGLLQQTRDADALAGIIAHEIGHVAHRDGLRNLIQAGGTGFLTGLLFGDVFGGGTLAGLAQLTLMANYSRRQELAADRFAARTLHDLGRPVHPFARFLLDLDAGGTGLHTTHPIGPERARAIREAGSHGPDGDFAREAHPGDMSLLTEGEWKALRGICGSRRPRPGEGEVQDANGPP